MKVLLFGILFSLLLSGCVRGPEESQLVIEIQSKLDERFGSGLFTVRDFQRRGHQPYTQQGGAGIIVYFKTRLVFNQDYQLSDWDAPGAGSLISLLGATSAGVTGIKPEGNKQGDELLVYGFATFSEMDGIWQQSGYLSDNQVVESRGSDVYIAEDDVAQGRYFAHQKSWHERVSEELMATIDLASNGKSPEIANQLKNDLESLLTQAKARVARTEGRTTLLSGAVSGNYYNLGRALQNIDGHQGVDDFEVIRSNGAIENLKLLREGMADFAFTQSDLAIMSANGTGPYKGYQDTKLRALASLYPEAIQVVVRKDSGIKDIADLKNRRINIGGTGSGGRLHALRLLEAYGIDSQHMTGMDMESSIDAFSAGALDGLIVTTASPSKLIESLGEQIRLLSISDDIRERLSSELGFIEFVIPGKTYSGQKEDITTLAVTAMLVTRDDVSSAEARKLLNLIYDNVASLAKTNVQANYIDARNATRGMAIKRHSVIDMK